jgi:hypothetical protein
MLGGNKMSKKHKPWVCLICLVAMKTIDEDHCKCPNCGTEVWYDYKEESDEDDIEELMQESIAGHNINPQFSIMNGPPAKGGGSSNGGRSRKKQLMQKPTTKELYNRLTK